MAICQYIAQLCEAESPLSGQVDGDNYYLGPRGAKGKRDRGARGKIITRVILKHHGNVYTKFVNYSIHINGIERFCGFAKPDMVKCLGIHPSMFHLNLTRV